MAFSPFLDNVIATASNDSLVKVWAIPEFGLTESLGEGDELGNLVGHQKKVMMIRWNPLANFTLASTSIDQTVKLWDVNLEKEVFSQTTYSSPWDLDWSLDGQLLSSVTKDKMATFLDPRVNRYCMSISLNS